MKTVTICGSTRHMNEISTAVELERDLGHRVLRPVPSLTDRVTLVRAHLDRIDQADEVLVVSPGGYIGETTAAEIAYALHVGQTRPLHLTRACGTGLTLGRRA